MFNTLSLLRLSLRIWKGFTDTVSYLQEIINLKMSEPHGNWRLAVVQSECIKTKLTYYVVCMNVERIFEGQEGTVN